MDDIRKMVKVKPLEWVDFDDKGAKASAYYQANYLIQWWRGEQQFEVALSFPGYQTGYDGPRWHDTLEAAKAAAQADYEARIYAALIPASDGRADGLREAARIARKTLLEIAGMDLLGASAVAWNAAREIDAILARAAEREGGSHE